MKGNCEDCKKKDDCSKAIGLMYGYCNTDFEPKKKTIETIIKDLTEQIANNKDEAVVYGARAKDTSYTQAGRRLNANLYGVCRGKIEAYEEIIEALKELEA